MGVEDLRTQRLLSLQLFLQTRLYRRLDELQLPVALVCEPQTLPEQHLLSARGSQMCKHVLMDRQHVLGHALGTHFLFLQEIYKLFQHCNLILNKRFPSIHRLYCIRKYFDIFIKCIIQH